jgi:iron complex outermembrane receptor protein
LLVVLLAACALASPARALEGVILGPDAAPLAGARITLVGRPGSAVTDSAGRFVLTPDPKPPFQVLVIQADGTTLRPIAVESLPEQGPLEISVPKELTEAITVVGGLVAELEVPPAGAVTLLGRGELEQRPPQRLIDVLKSVPGAWRSEETNVGVPSVRGLSRGRTLVLLDEGRVTAERRAGPSATFLNPETLEAVEVIRGPGSVAYGSDAFGGVIRAISRQPQPGAPTSAHLELTGSTAIEEAAASGEVTTDLLGGGLLAGFHLRRQGDYKSPDGEVANSSSKDYGVRLGFQRPLGRGNLHLGWRLDQARDLERPTNDSEVNRTYYPEENSNRLHFAYQIPRPGAWSEIEIGGFFDSYRLVTNRERLPDGEAPRRISEADVDAKDYGLRLEAERGFAWGSLKLGLDANGRFDLHAVDRTFHFDAQDNPAGTAESVTIDSANRNDLAAFAGLGGKAGPVELSGGVRFDQVWTRNNGGHFGDLSTSNRSVSGFVAASWSIVPALQLSLQAARGFRDPTLSDRYFRGVSGRGFVTGNPELKPESSRQFDASLRFTASRFSLGAFGYLYRIADLIERYQAGADFFFRNRAEAEIRGLELEAYVELGASLRLEASAQASHGEILDDGRPAADIPPAAVSLTLRRDPVERLSWMARFAAYARDDRPGEAEIETPGYSVVDAGAGYRVNDNVSVQLLGTNLLDKRYPAGADENAEVAPGRNFQLTLRLGI